MGGLEQARTGAELALSSGVDGFVKWEGLRNKKYMPHAFMQSMTEIVHLSFPTVAIIVSFEVIGLNGP